MRVRACAVIASRDLNALCARVACFACFARFVLRVSVMNVSCVYSVHVVYSVNFSLCPSLHAVWVGDRASDSSSRPKCRKAEKQRK